MNQPMTDIVVVDLSQIYNGPYATFLMASAGARVIKVEPPGGEPLRRRGVVGGAALPFAMLNGSKESICLDLKTSSGMQSLHRLLADADVLVDNFAPGAMRRLGLSHDEIAATYPRLICASSSGFGEDGPYANFPAMDLTVQAMSGVMSITGYPELPPVKAGPALCDFFAGVHLYGAIATALFERERTGRVRRVDVSMQDAVYPSLSSSLGLRWGANESDVAVPERTGNRHGGLAEAPYNVYPSSDGWVAIICVGENHWRSFCRVIERPELAEDARFATLAARVSRIDEVDELVSEWTSVRTKEEVFEVLIAAKVPCAPVRTLDEVMVDANMHARGSLVWQEHPELGRIVVPTSPLRFDGSPGPIPTPSRELGEDNASTGAVR